MKVFNRDETKEHRRQLRKSQTEAERILWRKLRNKQMHGYKIFRQYGIGLYIVDFYCPETKFVIEVDGGQHFSEKQQSYDKQREDFMKGLGLRTIRITNNDVFKNMEAVLRAIENELPLAPSLTKRGIEGD